MRGHLASIIFSKTCSNVFLYVFERVKNLYGRFHRIGDIMKYPIVGGSVANATPVENSDRSKRNKLKYVALMALVAQNASLVLMMRYVKTIGLRGENTR